MLRLPPASRLVKLQVCSMCGPKFCSMKITQDVRDYAEQRNLSEDHAIEAGLREQAEAFRRAGSVIDQPE